MTVNQEIDALQTSGFSPMEFLVLPRMLALMLMMPLLAVYADLMGILGGALVAVPVLDLSAGQYFLEVYKAVSIADFGVGIFMAGVYGVIVAVVGCLRGITCGRSAQAVGSATTSAVVSAIVLIVVSCAIMTVLFNALGI
jgi:phospholipid/cholesterol/gamma-HCH transport system permease protein